MKIIEHSKSIGNRYSRERYYHDMENKKLKQDIHFKYFLYATVIIFALVGIIVIATFAIKLGVLGTIIASLWAAGWWGAYTLIVLLETNKN